MKKIKLFIISLLLIITNVIFAQNITVTGTVTDVSTGEAIAGTTVLLQGNSTVWTTTDDQGFYSITVPSDGILEFSILGYEIVKLPVNKRALIDVSLSPEVKQFEEVIVVAYGTQKKEAFTGSASVVKGDQIMREAMPISAEKALQGYVPGVRVTQTDGQPGAKATVQIRGIGSINGNIEPLYVIDGVPMLTGDMSPVDISTNVLSALNPDDIESMTVLKDAAATSLYGSRAANGVIIITTKQGRTGKTQFDADYEHGWTTTAMPHEVWGLYMSGKEYTEYALEGLKNYYLSQWGALPGQPNYSAGNTQIINNAMDYAFANLHSIAKVIHPDDPLDGSFDYNTADPKKYLTNPRNTDWAKELFSMGHEDKINVSAVGGNDRLKFFTSLGYIDQTGMISINNFKRLTGKINIENKVNKWFNFAINETLGYTEQHGTETGNYYNNPISRNRCNNPTAPVYFPNGEYYTYPGFTTETPNYAKNRYEEIETASNFRSMTSLSVNIDFTDYLNFRTLNSIDFLNVFGREAFGVDSYDGKYEHGQMEEHFTKIRDFTTSNTLNFNKAFENHNISALAGFELRNFYRKHAMGSGIRFISDQFLELSNAAMPYYVEGSYRDDRLISWFLKADYNYKNKYYFSGSLRGDGSSRLAPKKRWGNFFALSAAWTLSNEDFMKSIEWIDNLRFKVSYGTTGNLPTDYYGYQSLFSLSNHYNEEAVFLLETIGNPNLTWEHSYTWNVGVDFRLFNSRLSGSLEYYNKLTDNLLNNVPVSFNTGFSTVLVNEGSLSNQGVELTLSSMNFVRKNFTWSTDFNISWMKAIVKSLADDVITSTQIFRQGENLYSFYMREWAGVDEATGQPMWYKNEYGPDGKTPTGDRSTTTKLDEANKIVLCKAYPDVYGGITNRFSFYGIDISFLFTYTLGGNMYYRLNTYCGDGYWIGKYNPTKEAAKGVWKKPGDKATKPMIMYGNLYQTTEVTSRDVTSTDHLRLKNIYVAYNLPSKWIKKIHVTNAKVYFNATDIFTLYKYDFLNPEVRYDGTNASSGYYYPALKSCRIGFQIKF